MNKQQKRKEGRPTGSKDVKRRESSPAITLWEMEHGVNVPQSGPTVFASEARNALGNILDELRAVNAWDAPERATIPPKCQIAATLPTGLPAEPYNQVSEMWVFNWLGKVTFGNSGPSLPWFAVEFSAQIIRVRPSTQGKLEELALKVFLVGTYVLRALVEKKPQGFTLTPKTFEKRPSSGQEDLAGLAAMAQPPQPDKLRNLLLKTALSLRRKKFEVAHKQTGADKFLTEEEVEIGFHELVKEHVGEDVGMLEVTKKKRLELIRRHAREFAAAHAIKIVFNRPRG